MDLLELFCSCRSGNLPKVRYLVEERDVDVNVRDNWDSTPLYYACLCGHIEVVQYLIGVGARCKANTFDGERCLYGALTDEIRRTLIQHNMITAHTIRRDAYNEFLRRLYETGDESDITIFVRDRKFFLHKCLLTARSPYFSHMLSSKWRTKNVIHIKNISVMECAFDSVMQYIYTGRLEFSIDLIDDCLTIAGNLKLPNFTKNVDEALKRATRLQMEKQGRVCVTNVVIEPEDCSNGVDADLLYLAQTTLPSNLRVWPTAMPFIESEIPSFADVCFIVEEQQFLCHKMFFRPRSEYFRALIADHFNESCISDDRHISMPTFNLHLISARCFAVVVIYLYSNQISSMICEDIAVDVLTAADMYLLPGLKRQCGVFLSNNLKVSSVFDIHKMARLFSLSRLEDQCVSFIAKYFCQLMHHNQLLEIILSDARDLKGRQEIDSVVFVDELRYHLSINLGNMSDIEETKYNIVALEKILEDLGVDV